MPAPLSPDVFRPAGRTAFEIQAARKSHSEECLTRGQRYTWAFPLDGCYRYTSGVYDGEVTGHLAFKNVDYGTWPNASRDYERDPAHMKAFPTHITDKVFTVDSQWILPNIQPPENQSSPSSSPPPPPPPLPPQTTPAATPAPVAPSASAEGMESEEEADLLGQFDGGPLLIERLSWLDLAAMVRHFVARSPLEQGEPALTKEERISTMLHYFQPGAFGRTQGEELSAP